MDSGAAVCDSEVSLDVSSFLDKGYLICRKLFSGDEISRVRRRAEQLVDDFVPDEEHAVFTSATTEDGRNDYFKSSGDKIRFFLEPKKEDGAEGFVVNKIGHALHELDPVFRRFSADPKILSICRQLGLRTPSIVQSMYILKSARVGGAVNPHQDGAFLRTEPPSILGIWTAIDRATIANGCLYVVPGSHKQGLLKRYGYLGDGSLAYDCDVEYCVAGSVALEAEIGDVVVLHGDVVHFSAPNTSAHPRHAYTLHVMETAAPYQWRKENWLQRPLTMPFRSLEQECWDMKNV